MLTTPKLPDSRYLALFRQIKIRRVITSDALQERLLRWLSTKPIRYRRAVLITVFTVLTRMPAMRPGPQLVVICMRVLSLPYRASQRLVRRSLLHDALFQMEWLALASRPTQGLIADGHSISTSAPDDLAWIAAQPGAVIATMHFGPYALGLTWLFHGYFRGRKLIIVKSRTDDQDEARAIARLRTLGIELEVMTPDCPQEFHRLLKVIRAGAIAFIMVDLPASYGKSEPLNLFGHDIRIAGGVVDLAALCAVPLMLFRVRSLGMRDVIDVDAIFEVARSDPASRVRAVTRISRFITTTLRDHAEQWHMWPRFQEYLALNRDAN